MSAAPARRPAGGSPARSARSAAGCPASSVAPVRVCGEHRRDTSRSPRAGARPSRWPGRPRCRLRAAGRSPGPASRSRTRPRPAGSATRRRRRRSTMVDPRLAHQPHVLGPDALRPLLRVVVSAVEHQTPASSPIPRAVDELRSRGLPVEKNCLQIAPNCPRAAQSVGSFERRRGEAVIGAAPAPSTSRGPRPGRSSGTTAGCTWSAAAPPPPGTADRASGCRACGRSPRC